MLLARIAVLLLAILFFSPITHAGPPTKKVDAWIMDYDDLMMTTPENRKKYLIELRAALVEFEKNSEEGLVVASRETFWNEIVSAFSIPGANAEGPCRADERHAFASKECVRVFEGRIPVLLDRFTYTCTKSPIDGRNECVRKAPAAVPGRRETTAANPCPGGSVAGLAASCSPGMRPTNVTVEGQRVLCCLPRDPPAPTPALVTPTGTTEKPPVPVPVAVKPTCKPGQVPATDNCTAVPTPAAAGPDRCEVKKPECEGDREKHRAEFYKEKRSCMYAGSVSDYAGAKPAKGKCKSVRSFKATEEDKPKECGKGKVICNPLVFGYAFRESKATKDPVCVPQSNEATEACHKSPEAPADNLNNLFAGDATGLKPAWNEYIQKVKKICNEDKASTGFHCKECGILMDRLFKIKKEIRGNLCAAAPAASGGEAPATTR